MDYQKMLLAAAARDLASAIRNGKSRAYWQALKDADDPACNEKRDQWEAEHSMLEFVPEALHRLQEVSDLIP